MRRLISVFLFLSFTLAGLALPDQESVFSHLSVAEGLSQCTVSSIVQDHDGLMWFATFDGVNRYDGYDFTVYRHVDRDPETIAGDVIRKLYVDSRGTLWAGTNKGLSWYDAAADKFRNLLVEDIHNFYDFVELSETEMLVAASRKAFIVDISNKTVLDSDSPVLRLSPRSFAKARGGVLVGSEKGRLFMYNHSDRSVDSLDFDLGRHPVMSLLFQTDDVVWAGTEGSGLFRIDLGNGTMKVYINDSGNPCGISSNYVRGLSFDTAGKLWIATGDNLSILDIKSGSISNINYGPAYPQSISHASIKTVCRDRTGGMWLGTYFGGVNYYHPLRDNFRRLDFNDGKPEIIGCIRIDGRGDFWIGTNRNGVLHYSSKTGKTLKVPVYNDGASRSREAQDIKTISFSPEEDKVYIGAAFDGMKEFHPSDGRIVTHRREGYPASVHAILRDDAEHMWIGSLTGFFYYDLGAGKFTQMDMSAITSDKISVLSLRRDSMGEVWIGAESGLIRCLPKVVDGVPAVAGGEYYQDIRWVTDIYESSDNVVWIASMNGLYRFNRIIDSDPVKVDLDGLRTTLLRGIEEDRMGRLWISTEDGLACFNPNTGNLRNYSSADGLPGNVFTMYSHAKASDGTLYFGGLDGIVYFSPEDIRDNNDSPSPFITGVHVSGSHDRVPIRDGAVVIGPRQNRFAIRFSVTDYPSWRENRFQYRMKGFDKDWNDSDLNRSAYYSNLPKGHYAFEVRSANNSGVWSERPALLRVTVRPVWYKSTLATILFILFALSTVAALILEMVARNEKKNRIQIDNLKARLYVASPGSITKPEVDFLNSALAVIEENMSNERFSVEEMADRLGVSRTNLHTKIKSVTGNSALALIKRIRFEEASRLLKETDIPIADVGSRVGFSSPTYFATNFKAIFGLTPKDYRKKYKF